jgi:hypothetical protein
MLPLLWRRNRWRQGSLDAYEKASSSSRTLHGGIRDIREAERQDDRAREGSIGRRETGDQPPGQGVENTGEAAVSPSVALRKKHFAIPAIASIWI